MFYFWCLNTYLTFKCQYNNNSIELQQCNHCGTAAKFLFILSDIYFSGDARANAIANAQINKASLPLGIQPEDNKLALITHQAHI